ncbi:hypothetical protein AB28_2331 [Raoultella ornithinolytica 2-156-04_S1_C2]|nr:hypothetical protein AB00_2143 [Raoultella ornithinolytica 2-156-04_S1_C1]KDX14228.1 hypothetical protein AB28_2331 [Raoultella ornithinolytica 2-156-04_S1_C2]
MVIKWFSECAGFVGWRLAPGPTDKALFPADLRRRRSW